MTSLLHLTCRGQYKLHNPMKLYSNHGAAVTSSIPANEAAAASLTPTMGATCCGFGAGWQAALAQCAKFRSKKQVQQQSRTASGLHRSRNAAAQSGSRLPMYVNQRRGNWGLLYTSEPLWQHPSMPYGQLLGRVVHERAVHRFIHFHLSFSPTTTPTASCRCYRVDPHYTQRTLHWLLATSGMHHSNDAVPMLHTRFTPILPQWK